MLLNPNKYPNDISKISEIKLNLIDILKIQVKIQLMFQKMLHIQLEIQLNQNLHTVPPYILVEKCPHP